jgi:predicted nuclease of predicted toxin-antitoxin system
VRFVADGGARAIYTSSLTAQNRTPDEILNVLSLDEKRVVVTKDSDFYYSRLLHGKPWKRMRLVKHVSRFAPIPPFLSKRLEVNRSKN